MKKYLSTHPWITFKLNLDRAGYKIWMSLGEAQSKSEHIANASLLPHVANYLHQVYLAKGVMATTAIEGNTLTEEDVKKRLEGKLELPLSKGYLGQEIDNIIAACNMLGDRIFQNPAEVSQLKVKDILDYNQQVLRNLPIDEGVRPGEIRKYDVGVGRYKGAPPEECEFLLEKLCDWLNTQFVHPPGFRTAFGVLKAIVAHVYLAWIHPFGDGNGRTARLIEFQLLLSAGVPSAAAHLLSNHYNQTRSEYYRQLDQASKSGGDLLPFIQYALQGFTDGLKEQIKVIRYQQWGVHWVNYLHERFPDDSKTHIRRRRLAIDLSEQNEPVPLPKLRHISIRLAEAYAGKTDKTLQRDVNALAEMGLVEKTDKGIRVKRELILAFLPASVDPN